MASSTDKLIYLDPKAILADDNVRFGHRQAHLDKLKASILAQGGVNTPVEVVTHKDGNGHTHRLTTGFGRHRVVTDLNAEGAGLLLPAIVREVADETERLKRQVSENADRENFSPMDNALAIKRMLANGISKEDIRTLFSRPGGRKGTQLQPASNAWVNMHLQFLELPKSIQNKIHEGLVGVGAAYELTKVAPEKRTVVLQRAEEQRLRDLDREEREEKKLLTQEEKEAEKAQKDEEAKLKLEAAQKAVADATKAKEDALALLHDKQAVKKEAEVAPTNFLTLPEPEKKAIAEKLAAAKADVRAAEKLHGNAVKTLDKVTRALKALTAPKVKDDDTPLPGEAEKPAKVAKAGSAGKSKGTAVGAPDVKKAAAAEGVGDKFVALTAAEMKTVPAELLKSQFTKTKEIGKLLAQCFNGEIATGTFRTGVELLLGERKKKIA